MGLVALLGAGVLALVRRPKDGRGPGAKAGVGPVPAWGDARVDFDAGRFDERQRAETAAEARAVMDAAAARAREVEARRAESPAPKPGDAQRSLDEAKAARDAALDRLRRIVHEGEK